MQSEVGARIVQARREKAFARPLRSAALAGFTIAL